MGGRIAGGPAEADIAGELHAFFRAMYPHAGVELEMDTDLLEEWFVDSFGIVQTVQFVEDRFGVVVARADIRAETFASIRTLVAFVLGKQG